MAKIKILTEKNKKNENNISLKEYMESRLEAMNKAVYVANAVMEKRLDSMNEFRESLRDATQTYATKNEVDLKLDSLYKNKKDSLALLLSIIGIGIGIISILLKLIAI